MPSVSIVVPVHNGAAYLAAAIRSVLRQEAGELEIIVVDDGSTDGSGDVARAFGDPVRVVRQEKGGPPVARNTGVALATGEYLGFLDADDVFTEAKLPSQLSRLEGDRTLDVVVGRQQYQELNVEADGTRSFAPRAGQGGHLSVQLGCILMRRAVFDRVGPLDPMLTVCDDWDWFTRLRELGVPYRLHRDLVLLQRLHETNLTRDREDAQRCLLLMNRRAITRRKALGADARPLPPLSSFLEPEAQEPAADAN